MSHPAGLTQNHLSRSAELLPLPTKTRFWTHLSIKIEKLILVRVHVSNFVPESTHFGALVAFLSKITSWAKSRCLGSLGHSCSTATWYNAKQQQGTCLAAWKTKQQPCCRSFGCLAQSLASGLPTDCSKSNAVVDRRDVVGLTTWLVESKLEARSPKARTKGCFRGF